MSIKDKVRRLLEFVEKPPALTGGNGEGDFSLEDFVKTVYPWFDKQINKRDTTGFSVSLDELKNTEQPLTSNLPGPEPEFSFLITNPSNAKLSVEITYSQLGKCVNVLIGVSNFQLFKKAAWQAEFKKEWQANQSVKEKGLQNFFQ